MTGSLQIKNSKYYVVLSFKDKNGVNKNKWVSTGYAIKGNKKRAEALIDGLIEKHHHLEYDGNKEEKLMFVDSIYDWLARKKNAVENSTYEGYEIYARRHIIPYFEELNLTLQEVTPKHIRDYYDYKHNSGRRDNKTGGLNSQSIKKHSIILKQVFNDALITEQISRNPASIIPIPQHEKQSKERFYLTSDEANRVLQAFNSHELQPLIYVTLYYGLRRSEALGLK